MIAPARRAAVDALRLVDEDALDMGAAVARVRASLQDERDRALLLELVGGTLRMRAAVDYQLALRVKRPLARLDAAVLTILRLGACQLLFMSKQPPSAVINDAVELTRRAGKSSAAAFTNAVLRTLHRERERLTWPPPVPQAEYLATVHSHPLWLVERWLDRHGAPATEQWLRFNNEPAAMCLAANRRLNDRDALAQMLEAEGVTTRPTMRARHGLQVTGGRALASRAFAEGRFVIQDEASQLIGEEAPAPAGSRVLDLCASPGGKTLALSAAVGSGGTVIACDVRAARVRLLAKTVSRCALANVRVAHVAGEGPLPFAAASFTTVLIDAPCSGLGTIRRDPDIRWKRSPDDLPRLAAAQTELLDRAAALVKSGGTLVYATCSSEPEENQQVAEAFLGSHPEFSLVRMHQTLPFRDGLEAFFAAHFARA